MMTTRGCRNDAQSVCMDCDCGSDKIRDLRSVVHARDRKTSSRRGIVGQCHLRWSKAPNVRETSADRDAIDMNQGVIFTRCSLHLIRKLTSPRVWAQNATPLGPG